MEIAKSALLLALEGQIGFQNPLVETFGHIGLPNFSRVAGPIGKCDVQVEGRHKRNPSVHTSDLGAAGWLGNGRHVCDMGRLRTIREKGARVSSVC